MELTPPRPALSRSGTKRSNARWRRWAFRCRFEAVGAVPDTRDEAVAVGGLARARGWWDIIVVTHPWHMRRAAAAFEKAGPRVVRAPSPDGEHGWKNPTAPATNCAASGGGYRYYRLRRGV